MPSLPFQYAVRNLTRSPLRLALSVAGSLLVVLLILAAAAFVRGMESSLRSAGSPDNVLLLGAGSEESLERSEITAAAASLVAASVPGVKHTLGVAHASPEVHAAVPLQTSPHDDAPRLALLRGVTPAAFLVHPQVQIIDGRAPRPGHDELLAGTLAAAKMGLPPDRLLPGQTLYLDGRAWTITGRFAAPGSAMEAELWAPLTDLKLALKRDTDSCVILTLDRAAGAEFADVDLFAKSRLDLELVAIPEDQYYAKLSDFYAPVRAVAWTTAVLIGLGGLLGGLNTMYAAFAARVRELGMLQCLGYRRSAIVVSLVQESLLTAAAGALAASALALAVLDGLAVRFSMRAFVLTIDSAALATGLGAGLLLGLIGALPPAYRCLKMAIPEALKAE